MKNNNKCVAKSCNFQGLNPNNKSAVGVCANCGHFEHFSCVGVSQEYKDDIVQGKNKYYCSQCFSRNPSIANTQQDEASLTPLRPRLGSVPIVAQGYLFKATHTKKMIAYESESKQENQINRSGNEITNTEHVVACSQTTKSTCKPSGSESINSDELQHHVHKSHIISCDYCDALFVEESDLRNHVTNYHTVQCDKCEKSFQNHHELLDHNKSHHDHCCQDCNHVAVTLDDLQKHIESIHTENIHECSFCAARFKSEINLENHINQVHSFLCSQCDEQFPNEEA